MTDLKPCPFCGSNQLRIPKTASVRNSNLEMVALYIECMDCGADGPKITYSLDVVEAWNKRIESVE